MTRITDRNGQTLTLAYDGDKLTTITDPDQRVIRFGYQSGSPLIRSMTLEWANQTHEYRYDSEGRLNRLLQPAG